MTFASLMYAEKLEIWETYAAPFVKSVALEDEAGNVYTSFTGTVNGDYRSSDNTACGGVYTLVMDAPTDYKVAAVRITTAASGYEMIDAVRLHGHTECAPQGLAAIGGIALFWYLLIALCLRNFLWPWTVALRRLRAMYGQQEQKAPSRVKAKPVVAPDLAAPSIEKSGGAVGSASDVVYVAGDAVSGELAPAASNALPPAPKPGAEAASDTALDASANGRASRVVNFQLPAPSQIPPSARLPALVTAHRGPEAYATAFQATRGQRVMTSLVHGGERSNLHGSTHRLPGVGTAFGSPNMCVAPMPVSSSLAEDLQRDTEIGAARIFGPAWANARLGAHGHHRLSAGESGAYGQMPEGELSRSLP